MVARMRLREIGQTIATALPLLRAVQVEKIQVQHSGDVLGRITGNDGARRALDALATLPIGQSTLLVVGTLRNLPSVAVEGKGPVMPLAPATAIHKDFQDLVARLVPLLEAINAAAPISAGTLLVKLPAVDSLDDTAKVLQAISRAFDQPLGRLNEAPLKVEGVDTGSMWLVLSTATASALDIARRLVEGLAKLVDSIRHYRTHMKFLESIKSEPEIRKQQEELNQKAQSLLIDSLARSLAEDPTGSQPRPVDPELVNTYVNSLKELQDLSNRGAEIRLLAAAQVLGAKKETAAVGEPAQPAQLPGGGTPSSG